MKKLLITIACISCCFLFRTSAAPSELNISLYDQSSFNLVIDNQVFNYSSTSYTIPDIYSGNHFIKIFRLSSYGANQTPILFFSGTIFIPEGSIVFSIIDYRRRYVVVSQEHKPTYEYYGGHNGNNGHGNGNGHGHGFGNGPGCGNGNSGYISPVMTNSEFNNLRMVIDGSSFDSSKLSIAKQAVASNWLTSAQVTELMHLLTFESSKLDLAKFAYNRVVDQENYYMVNSAFTFSSSIDELNQYLWGN